MARVMCADVEVCAFGAAALEADGVSGLACGGLHVLGRLEGYDLVEVVELEYLDPHVGGVVVPDVGGDVVVYVPDGLRLRVECGGLVVGRLGGSWGRPWRAACS